MQTPVISGRKWAMPEQNRSCNSTQKQGESQRGQRFKGSHRGPDEFRKQVWSREAQGERGTKCSEQEHRSRVSNSKKQKFKWK